MNNSRKNIAQSIKWSKSEIFSISNQSIDLLKECFFIRETPNDIIDIDRINDNLSVIFRLNTNLAKTFETLNLKNASFLSDSIAKLCQSIPKLDKKQQDFACSLLTKSLLILPNYIEYLSTGRKDIASIIVKNINEINEFLKIKKVSELDSFYPDTDIEINFEFESDRITETNIQSLHENFNKDFDNWLKQDNVSLIQLTKTSYKLIELAKNDISKKIFWIAACIFESISDKSIDADINLKHILAKLPKEVLNINSVGSKEILRQLLFIVSTGYQKSPHLTPVFELFKLHELVPEKEDIVIANTILKGRDYALLESVSNIIKEDIVKLRDALDVFARTLEVGILEDLSSFSYIPNTLKLIEFNKSGQIMATQFNNLVNFDFKNPDKDKLLSIASNLLICEQSMQEELYLVSGFVKNPYQESANIELIKQSKNALNEAKKDIKENNINSLIDRVNSLSGVTEILNLNVNIFKILSIIINQIEKPFSQKIEELIVAYLDCASLFLEYIQEDINTDKVLQSIEEIQFEIVSIDNNLEGFIEEKPKAPTITINKKLKSTSSHENSTDSIDHLNNDLKETSIKLNPFDGNSLIDDELKEIFLSELEEEIANLDSLLVGLQPSSKKELESIRKIFHTLKGSGKMVGAESLGEVSKKIEQYLNECIDNIYDTNDQTLLVINTAADYLKIVHDAIVNPEKEFFYDVNKIDSLIDTAKNKTKETQEPITKTDTDNNYLQLEPLEELLEISDTTEDKVSFDLEFNDSSPEMNIFEISALESQDFNSQNNDLEGSSEHLLDFSLENNEENKHLDFNLGGNLEIKDHEEIDNQSIGLDFTLSDQITQNQDSKETSPVEKGVVETVPQFTQFDTLELSLEPVEEKETIEESNILDFEQVEPEIQTQEQAQEITPNENKQLEESINTYDSIDKETTPKTSDYLNIDNDKFEELVQNFNNDKANEKKDFKSISFAKMPQYSAIQSSDIKDHVEYLKSLQKTLSSWVHDFDLHPLSQSDSSITAFRNRLFILQDTQLEVIHNLEKLVGNENEEYQKIINNEDLNDNIVSDTAMEKNTPQALSKKLEPQKNKLSFIDKLKNKFKISIK